MENTFEAKLLGVLGGMGPMAGAVFMERLTAMTHVQNDQQHIPAVLWSDPRVPDRTQAKLHGGENPLPWLLNGIRHLEQAGANAIAIPCNSAHMWYGQMAGATRLPILHIVKATVDDLQNRGVRQGKIGVMGTDGTLKTAMYQQELESRGFTCVVPTEEEIVNYCTPAISLVKANQIAEAYNPAIECIQKLKQRGALAVVLGCTELPLAVPHKHRPELGLEVADSIDGLAAAAIRWYFGTSAAVGQR
jgi:aspartate racemase